jgi:hypothetical protein
MTRTTHNGIPVIIFNDNESRLINFYRKHKNQNIGDLANKFGRTPFEINRWLKEGKRLIEI